MRLLFILAATAFCALQARAAIGENPSEVAHRYGSEGHIETISAGPSIKLIRYGRAGFDVEVTFVNGESVREVFRRRHAGIGDEEIEQLLRNMNLGSWKRERAKKTWTNSHHSLQAYRDPDHLDDLCVEKIGAPHVHPVEDPQIGKDSKKQN